MAGSEPVSRVAEREGVSRKFIQQCGSLANRLARLAQGSAIRRQKAEQRMAGVRQEVCGDALSSALAKARSYEAVALGLA